MPPTELMQQSHHTLQAAYEEAAHVLEKLSARLSSYEGTRAQFALVSALSLAHEMWIRKGDPARPAFTAWSSNGRQTMGSAPHVDYQSLPVSVHHSYRIYGRLPRAGHVTFQLYRHERGQNVPSRHLSRSDLHVQPDGSIELLLAARPAQRAPNWLPLSEGDSLLLVTIYDPLPDYDHNDTLLVERLDRTSSPFLPLYVRENRAASWFTARMLAALDLVERMGVNAFGVQPPAGQTHRYGEGIYPQPDCHFDGMRVRVEPGHALELSGRLPRDMCLAGFHFADRWLCPLDEPSLRSHISSRELRLEADGSWRIYLSPERPAHSNWIQMGPLGEGVLAYSMLRTGDAAPSSPSPRLAVRMLGPDALIDTLRQQNRTGAVWPFLQHRT